MPRWWQSRLRYQASVKWRHPRETHGCAAGANLFVSSYETNSLRAHARTSPASGRTFRSKRLETIAAYSGRMHAGAAPFPLEIVAYYLIAINFVAFAAFGIDKVLAEANSRRISESELLGLALIGGSPGAYAGRHLFRHKTRKQPFSNTLHAIALLQTMAIAGFATWHVTG